MNAAQEAQGMENRLGARRFWETVNSNKYESVASISFTGVTRDETTFFRSRFDFVDEDIPYLESVASMDRQLLLCRPLV